jgi:hypothetical protein
MLDALEQAAAKRRAARQRPHHATDRPDPNRPEHTDYLPEIEHIVVLMMENHSYDNYLGRRVRETPPERSCGGGVLVYQPAEDLVSADARDRHRYRRHLGCGWMGRTQCQAAMRPVLAIVTYEAVEHSSKMLLSNDEETVGAFQSHGPDPTLGNGVRVGCPDGTAPGMNVPRLNTMPKNSASVGIGVTVALVSGPRTVSCVRSRWVVTTICQRLTAIDMKVGSGSLRLIQVFSTNPESEAHSSIANNSTARGASRRGVIQGMPR